MWTSRRWPFLGGGLILLAFLARRAAALRLMPIGSTGARLSPPVCVVAPSGADDSTSVAEPLPPKLQKVHHSSVALIPPDACWGPIQAVRLELRDKGLYRWPPHINLLYPFAPPGQQMEDALADLAAAAAAVPPFDLRLDTLGTFGGRTRGVLWAAPSDPRQLAALVALQDALQSAAPFFGDQQRVGGGGFVPHMVRYIGIYMYIYVYTHIYICMYIYICIYIYINISLYLSIYLSIHPSIYLSIYVTICIYTYISG